MTLRVAVTGASGFVGGRIADRLSQEGHRVVAFGRRPTDRVPPRLRDRYRPWDIATGPLADAPPVDAVVHCAARVDDWGRREAFEAVNVRGTRNVLTTWPTARFVHLSSCSVYDPHGDHGRVREEDADPRDARAAEAVRWVGHYGRTKRAAEVLVAREESRPWVILRPHAIYGPGDTTLLPRILARIRLGRLWVAGRPGNRITVTAVETLCEAVLCALSRGDRGVYNVADGETLTLHEVLTALLAGRGHPPRIVYLPMALAWALASVAEPLHGFARLPRPVVTRHQLSHLRGDFVVDIARAREELGWTPVVDPRSGLRTASAPPGSAEDDRLDTPVEVAR